jgi:hypothetical protein
VSMCIPANARMGRSSQLIACCPDAEASSRGDVANVLQYDSPAFDMFKAALPDAIRWCFRAGGPRLGGTVKAPDPALRSMELCPQLFSGNPSSLVWSVVSARRTELGMWNVAVPDTVSKPAQGGLLYFDPSMTLSDGAALVSSAGYFDNHNVPPWDTWLCLADDRFLVSWVPPAYAALVDAGIDVNPEGCILWARNADTPFTQVLRGQGLL